MHLEGDHRLLQDYNGSDTHITRAIVQQLPPQERQRLLHAPIAQSLEGVWHAVTTTSVLLRSSPQIGVGYGDNLAGDMYDRAFLLPDQAIASFYYSLRTNIATLSVWLETLVLLTIIERYGRHE